MKILVKVSEYGYVDPNEVQAVVATPQGTTIALSSGEAFTFPDVDAEDVLDTFESALRNAKEAGLE